MQNIKYPAMAAMASMASITSMAPNAPRKAKPRDIVIPDRF